MMRRLLVVVTLFVLAAGLREPSSSAIAQGDAGSQVIALVNALRASYGLPPLTPHPALNAAAQSHANWIIATGQWGHVGEGGSSPQDRATAAGYSGFVLENYVGGSNMSPQRAVDWWTNSPIHLRGMLATPHEHVGIGVVTGGTNLYVLLVGRPATARPAAGPGGSGSVPGSQEEEEPAVIAVPVVRAEPRPDGSIVHQVQQGQTVWDLAMVYGVDLGELRALNNLGPSMVIHPGDEILIQLGPGMAPPPTPTMPMSVFVQEGQTLWDIAAIYNVNLDELLLINSLQRGDIVHPGDELLLRLPPGVAPPPTPTPPLTHRVREGETAWTIAARYGLTLDELLDLNDMERPAIVYPGDELLIRTPDPTATPTDLPTDTPAPPPSPLPTATPEPVDATAQEPAAETDIEAMPESVQDGARTPTATSGAPSGGPIIIPTRSEPEPQETPALPVENDTGTPIAMLSAPEATPLLASLTPLPAPTQLVARPASPAGSTNQPYLIGAIMVLAGMAALGWMALMALLRRQQM